MGVDPAREVTDVDLTLGRELLALGLLLALLCAVMWALASTRHSPR
jgi:hypothetical protein